jgi:diacylglycerol kinase (ATP)
MKESLAETPSARLSSFRGDSMKIGVVINPRAGGGRMAAAWPRLLQALEARLGAVEAVMTRTSGEASGIAQGLTENGCDLVIAAGGDGTIGDVADGILRAGGTAELGIIPVGTGVDFPRSVGLSRTRDAIAAIAAGRVRKIDAGRATYLGDDGEPAARHFVNEASFGLSGPIVRAVNGAKTGGPADKLIFLGHTLAQLIRFEPQRFRVILDGAEEVEDEFAVVAVCNGRYFGAGLKVAPDALLDDGLFDVVMVRATGKLALVDVLARAYRGAHVTSPLCVIRQARLVELLPVGEPPLVDIDGESPGRIPARVEMLPGALRLRG